MAVAIAVKNYHTKCSDVIAHTMLSSKLQIDVQLTHE